ncbi:hypothetical protein HanPSC8_Chr17g0795161 [Helianthus annuus]|nr:hypothetical protein HanPSC8_Chr17g0795161 [Helianthus annuus]
MPYTHEITDGLLFLFSTTTKHHSSDVRERVLHNELSSSGDWFRPAVSFLHSHHKPLKDVSLATGVAEVSHPDFHVYHRWARWGITVT